MIVALRAASSSAGTGACSKLSSCACRSCSNSAADSFLVCAEASSRPPLRRVSKLLPAP